MVEPRSAQRTRSFSYSLASVFSVALLFAFVVQKILDRQAKRTSQRRDHL